MHTQHYFLRYLFNPVQNQTPLIPCAWLDEGCCDFTQYLWYEICSRMERRKERFWLVCLNKWLFHCLQTHAYYLDMTPVLDNSSYFLQLRKLLNNNA